MASQSSAPRFRSAQPEPKVAQTFQTSERVFHPKFGEGTIVEIVDRRDDQELSIDFARHGKKRFLASLTPLDTIANPALNSNEP